MDPLSFLFSAYLDSVSNNVHQHLTDTMGTELQAVVIEYQGVEVPFQYQMWQVRKPSVCSSYQTDLVEYSGCTVKASALFNDLCKQLTKNPKEHWRYVKTKNMYCNAAVSYQPTIAAISKPKTKDEVQLARQRCNSAVANALGSSDPKVIAERKRACEEYETHK